MGKLNSIFLRNSKGRLAGTTIYSTGGVTIQREIQTQVRNPRTKAQMSHRVKLANLVNMYRAMKPFFKKAFENKGVLVSDYNKFVSLNLTANEIYLTKQAASEGYFEVSTAIISQGSLPIKATTGNNEGAAIGLTVGSSFTIGSDTTVGDLSSQLINNNPGVVKGMQLSLVIIACSSAGTKPTVSLLEMIIDPEDDDSLVKDFFGSFLTAASGKIKAVVPAGEWSTSAFVLSHTVAGKTLVSTETLRVGGMENMMYYGENALQYAIDSYGQSEEVFLDSDSAQKA